MNCVLKDGVKGMVELKQRKGKQLISLRQIKKDKPDTKTERKPENMDARNLLIQQNTLYTFPLDSAVSNDH